MADAFRIVAVVLALCLMYSLPFVIMAEARPRRAWLLTLALEGFMFSCVSAILVNYGEPDVRWYRTPVTIAFGIVGLVYLVVWRRDMREAERRNYDEVQRLRSNLAKARRYTGE